MYSNKTLFMCPHLDGSRDGAVCHAADKLIKNIKDINVKICMSRHFEACYIYFSKLQEMNVAAASPNKQIKRVNSQNN